MKVLKRQHVTEGDYDMMMMMMMKVFRTLRMEVTSPIDTKITEFV